MIPLPSKRLILCAIAATVFLTPGLSAQSDPVYERSITELQSAMASGKTTSVALVNAYLARIAAYDHAGPALNAMIYINPRAREEAAAMDAERKAGKVRGPMHGIPVIVKDNYGTREMPTSAGSIALAGMRTPDDAFEVKKLRAAGAVILGKSNMHEMASGITSISSIGGQTCNPYDPDRLPGGSSGGSGAAVAASYSAVAWGSDTCGSIRIPSAVHNLYGLRPTKGLTSISGVVPLSHTQDVTGPLARSVMDLAIALDATVGPDPADTATRILSAGTPSFVKALDSTSLRGKRIGVLASYFGTESDDAEGAAVVRASLAQMKARGAEVVDIAIPGLDSVVNRASVINYEFKYDLIDFLSGIPNAPVKSLGEALDEGLYHTALDVPLHAREANGTRNGAEYLAALARRVVARDLVTSFMDANHLDVIAYPVVRRKAAYIGEPQRGSTCQLSAVTGLPALAMPAGFTPDGLPIGVELLGRPLSDPQLVSLAYDYEHATHPRRAPSTTPPLVNGKAPAPRAYRASKRDANESVTASFAHDAPHRMLSYDVRVTGAGDVYAISLDRDSAGVKGPVLRVLTGPGPSVAKGAIKLTDAERVQLSRGQLAIVAYTRAHPHGALRSLLSASTSR